MKRQNRRGGASRQCVPKQELGNEMKRKLGNKLNVGLGGTRQEIVMRAVDVLQKKRDGGDLSRAESRPLFRRRTDGGWPDYQVSALLMAIYLRGMSERETSDLTRAMAHSGTMLDWSDLPGPRLTSTAPAASATRRRSSWFRWRRRVGSSCRRCPAAAWGIPAARWTSWSRSRDSDVT